MQVLRGLTFELRRPARWCAWAAQCRINHGAARPKCTAVWGRRLERGVRPRVAVAPKSLGCLHVRAGVTRSAHVAATHAADRLFLGT